MSMESPGDLPFASIESVLQKLQDASLTSEALVRECLLRIEKREPAVGAWAYVDAERALQAARECDRTAPKGLLHGIPFGIKDVIDTTNMPTSYGSDIYAGHRPVADAFCVARIKQAGGIILGKTTTSEFAHSQPPATRNPHNLEHTPGGSSSGSAAAVADFMVPAAIATQTGGSTIRPAAYCGIVGFKPSFGLINRAGTKPVAESLDTLGIMARTVADVALLMRVLVDDSLSLRSMGRQRPRIGICRTPYWDNLDAITRTTLDAVATQFRDNGAQLTEISFSGALLDSYDDQRLIMNYEAARALLYESTHHPEKLSQVLTDHLQTGRNHDFGSYMAAQERIGAAQLQLGQIMRSCDVLLTPSAPGAAPLGITQSGESTVNRNWTALGVPCITLPAACNPDRLPIGIQLVGHRNRDAELLSWANWAQSVCSTTVTEPSY